MIKRMVCIALISFAAGSWLTAQVNTTPNDDRVYELLIYHAVPGKVGKLESRFRQAAPEIAAHNLDVLGYWVADSKPGWEDTFVYLIAHRNRDEAKANWHSFHTAPEFQKYLAAEKEEKLIQQDDKVFMRPTDFSKLR